MTQDVMMTDLRFWDHLEGGAGERGEPGLRLRSRSSVTLIRAGQGTEAGVDLATVGGSANLTQALLHRLFTQVGELADLGHPEYGSRLHLLVGEPNTPGNRGLLKLFMLEALARESRIRADQIRIDVEAHPTERTAAIARIAVEPVDGSGPLEFAYTFGLNDGFR